MKKVINSLIILIAISFATTSCGKFPEPPTPDPLQPAVFVYYFPSVMNDVAMVPTNLAKRLELYIANGKTDDAQKAVLKDVTVRETSEGANIWKLGMISTPIGPFRVSGTISIDMSDPAKIVMSTENEGLTVGGSILLKIPEKDGYVIAKTEGVWTVDYRVSMKHSSSDQVYAWKGDLMLVDAESNTTNLAKLEELKYVIDDCKSSGQVAIGDGVYVIPGMKMDYEVVEPLHYARAKGKTGVPYTKLTSGRDKVIPYNTDGSQMINHTVEVCYVSQSVTDPYDTSATKVVYYYQDIIREME